MPIDFTTLDSNVNDVSIDNNTNASGVSDTVKDGATLIGLATLGVIVKDVASAEHQAWILRRMAK